MSVENQIRKRLMALHTASTMEEARQADKDPLQVISIQCLEYEAWDFLNTLDELYEMLERIGWRTEEIARNLQVPE